MKLSGVHFGSVARALGGRPIDQTSVPAAYRRFFDSLTTSP
jgi:hypothetical protein